MPGAQASEGYFVSPAATLKLGTILTGAANALLLGTEHTLGVSILLGLPRSLRVGWSWDSDRHACARCAHFAGMSASWHVL